MKKICLIIIFCFSFFSFHSAALAQEVLLDHDWYLAGEKMTVAVQVTDGEKASKVAYVELCDSAGLQASALISLVDGRGQGFVYLPSTLHSGYYQLNTYTRMGKEVCCRMVPVINIMQKSVADDISWKETSSDSFGSTKGGGAESKASLPSVYLNTYGERAENEGHCIYARVHHPSGITDYKPLQNETTLSVVGREFHVFHGRMVDDSTVVFNTYNVNGRHSIVMTAKTYDGKPLDIDIVTPFAIVVPKKLPHLEFSYNRAEVEKRSAQMQAAVGDTMVVDSTVFKDEFFSTKPIVSYNLDEYRQFHTIREVLLEYVQFVHRVKKSGFDQLFIGNYYTASPALVLLDGVPVSNIDQLLDYDARRVKHISIYNDDYTIGDKIYSGIVNVVTRTARMTNFPLEPSANYLIYDFPQ